MNLFRRLVSRNFARDTATDPTVVLGVAAGVAVAPKAAPIVAAAVREAHTGDVTVAQAHDGNDGALPLGKGSATGHHAADGASPVSHFHDAAGHAPLPEKHAPVDPAGHDPFAAAESLIGNHAGVLTEAQSLSGNAFSIDAGQNFGAFSANLTSFIQAEHDSTASHHAPAQPAPATVDPELWIAATGGGDQNLITHADDDGTGGGIASNAGSLIAPGSANNPSDADGIDSLDLLQLDTQDNVYVIGTQHNADPAKIMIGSLSSVLASPTNTPAFTTLFSDSSATAAITGLAVDPDNSTVYFVDSQSFEKVGYAGGAVTTLDNSGTFLDGLALDLPHDVAYFANSLTGTTTTTTHVGGGSNVHYHTGVNANAIYETSSLTNASSTVTISKLADVPVTDGALFDGAGMPGITVDTATGTIYFTTKTITGTGEGGIWSMDPSTHVITKIYQQTGSGGTVDTGIMSSIVIDHATNEYFVSILNHNGTGGGIYVGHLGSTAAPTLFETMPTFSGGTIDPNPNGFSLDNAPTFASVTGTAAYALQGGSAINALVADGSDSDTDNDKGDGAKIVITNAQTGDLLLIGGAQSGNSGGITWSFNSATHTMTLFGTASFASYQALIDQIQFQDTGTDNSTGSHPTRTITFQTYDGLLYSAVTGATTTTLLIDRAPTLGSDSYAVLESATSTGTSGTGGTGVFHNDSDKDGDPITVTAVNGSAANVGTSTPGTYGHLTLSSDGSYSYAADNTAAIDAAPNGSHPVDTFTYTVSDGLVGSTTTTVSFTIDRAPTVVADNPAGEALESGSPILGNVLTNDSDKDGDTLAVSAVNGVALNVGASVAGTYGHITIAANGGYSYTADNTAAIDGAATGSHLTDTFSYTADDGHGGTTTTNIVVTVDRAPTVVADNPAGEAVESGSALLGNVLTNDSDRDGDTLAVSAVNGVGGNVGASVAGTYGHITIAANGGYSYTADNTVAIDGAATGSHLTDTFSYTASDGHGGTTTTNLVVTVDRAPTVVADTSAALEGASGTGNVLTNDSDRDGDTLTVSAVNGVGGNVGNSVAGTYGHLTIAADGSYTYQADNIAAIDGAATGSHLTDTFSYTASDGLGGTTTTNVVITLDRAPTVVADNGAAVEAASGTGNVLTNDSDRDGDTLTVSAVNGVGGNVGSSVAGTYGHLTLNGDGSYSYTADNTVAIDGAATGSHLTDTFTYTASDGLGGFTSSSITVTLDRAPAVATQNENVAESGTDTGTGGTAGTGALAGDSDRDGDAIQVTKLDGNAINDTLSNFAGTYGHLTLGNDGSYSYVADITAAIDGAAAGSHPVDNFTVTVDDGHGGTTNETLAFTIDRPAVAAADSLSTFENSDAVPGGGNPNLLANDVDPDTNDNTGIVLTAVNGSGANVGTQISLASGALLTVNGDGTYTYDPNHAFDYLPGSGSGASNTSATDTFTYTINSGSTVTVTVTVNGVDSNDKLIGTSGGDTLHGGIGDDVITPLAGVDTIFGDQGNDVILMGANLTAADQIDGGSGAGDLVVLNGDYSAGLTFNPTTMVNVEFLRLMAGHSYALTMDNATVAAGHTLTVQGGLLGAGDSLTFDGSADTSGGVFVINGGAGNDTLTGGSGADTIRSDGGTDTLNGGGGNDVINMDASLTAADKIDGGAGNNDTVYLNGDYSGGVVFNATTMVNVETFTFAAGNDYNLTIADATVAAGQTLRVQGGNLGAGDNLTFDGSADVTGGILVLNGGAGNDTLTGGHSDDIIRGGGGTNTLTGGGGADLIVSTSDDTFVYNAVSDSTSVAHDTVQGFDAASDTFKLTGVTVNAIDAAVTTGNLSGGHVDPAHFDANLARAIGAGQLAAHDAVLFTPNGGTQAGHTFLIVDVNGVAGYQASQDFVIDITGASNLNLLAPHNFTS